MSFPPPQKKTFIDGANIYLALYTQNLLRWNTFSGNKNKTFLTIYMETQLWRSFFVWLLLIVAFVGKFLSSSSSSCRAISTDILDPLSPHLPIVHCFWQTPRATIPYRHRAAVCWFELDILPLLVHVKGSAGAIHLWARPYFSSSVPCV